MIRIGVVNIDTSHPKAFSEYLKKNNLRDFFHVIATSKSAYQIRFGEIGQEAAEAEADE